MGYSVAAEGQVLIRLAAEQEAVAAVRAAYAAAVAEGQPWGWANGEMLGFTDEAPIDVVLAAAGFDDASIGEMCDALGYMTVDLAHGDSMDTIALAAALAALSPYVWADDLDLSFVECRGEDEELWRWRWAEGDDGVRLVEDNGRIVWS